MDTLVTIAGIIVGILILVGLVVFAVCLMRVGECEENNYSHLYRELNDVRQPVDEDTGTHQSLPQDDATGRKASQDMDSHVSS